MQIFVVENPKKPERFAHPDNRHEMPGKRTKSSAVYRREVDGRTTKKGNKKKPLRIERSGGRLSQRCDKSERIEAIEPAYNGRKKTKRRLHPH